MDTPQRVACPQEDCAASGIDHQRLDDQEVLTQSTEVPEKED